MSLKTDEEIRKVYEAIAKEMDRLNPISKANSQGMLEMAAWILGESDDLDEYLEE